MNIYPQKTGSDPRCMAHKMFLKNVHITYDHILILWIRILQKVYIFVENQVKHVKIQYVCPNSVASGR